MLSEKEKIMKDISLRCYIPLEVVESVIDSQFKFLADTISSGDRRNPSTLKSVNLKNLGRFVIKETRMEFYKKLKEDADRVKDVE
jgi:nucleoid DNA-binding protein